MMKQVQHTPHGRPQPPIDKVTGLGMAALVSLGFWLPLESAQAQVRSRVTFEMPAVCEADLDQVVPEPGEALEDLPLALLAPAMNPLSVPTQPSEVEITGQQPLSLAQAVELAYRHNPDLETARLAVERSRAALDEAQASLYPRVDLNTRLDVLTNPALGQDQDEAAGISTLGALTGNISAEYDVFTGGERTSRIATAELELRQQQLAMEQEQADLRSQISVAYYDVQSAREQIRISQAFLAESCRNLRDTSLFYDADVGTRFDVLRADVQVAQARQDLALARSTWETTQRQLAALLNLPAEITVSTTPISIRGIWPLTLEESIVLAFQNRAELENDLVQREVAAAQRQIALSTIRPRLQATGSVNAAIALNDISGANIPGFDSNASGGFGLGLGSSWRLFDGGAAQARADQAVQDQAIAESTYSQDRYQIQLLVEEAYFTLEANLTNIDTARTSLEQAREALRLARRRFDAGVGDQLDVLVAQRELTEAQVNLLESILGYNRSLTSLERAVSNLAN